MDFHSLSRRELQSLCKKNKIPANMTNLAMADALSALTNVEGIEDIGKCMPETPITCRKTSTRKPTKPQSDQIKNEPESSLPQSQTRRAPRKLIQEEEHENREAKDVTENPSLSEISKTPAARTGRKRATGTSVSRKIDTQTEVKKEIPVVAHAYSTRRSTRVQQSEPKISDSVQERVGRRREVVKIEMLSKEETDGLEESKSEVIDEVLKNDGATVVSTESSATDMCTEKSDKNMSHVLGESSPLAKAQILEDAVMNALPSVEDECMKDVDQVIENNEDGLCDVMVTEVEEIILDESSALEEKTQNLEDLNGECLLNLLPSDQDQANEFNEDGLCDVMVTKVEESFLHSEILDFGSLKASLQEVVKNLDTQQEDQDDDLPVPTMKSFIVSLPSEVSIDIQNESENSVADDASLQEVVNNLDTQQEDQEDDLPVPTLKSVIVSLPSEVSTDIQNESENSVADDGLENQIVQLEKSDSANAASYESEVLELDSGKFSTIANVDAADFDLTEGTSAILDDEVQWSSDGEASESDSEVSDSEVVEEVSDVVEKTSFSSTDLTLNQIPMSVLTPTKLAASENQIQGTPLRSSTKKKAPTIPIIKVLDDNMEDNESDKVILKSNSKVLSVVAEEKENNETSKGENTGQRKIKGMSLRKLRKMLKECKISDKNNSITTTTTENDKNTVVKEFEKKRSALQPLNDNCPVGDGEN